MDDNYWKHLNSRKTIYTCQFIFSCMVITIMPKGIPEFTDQSRFEGKIIHPQKLKI
jgi:cation diffusion facilitator CzcD-associated flavoprotein CzcO